MYDPYRVGPSHRYRDLGLRPRLLERAFQARRVGRAIDVSGQGCPIGREDTAHHPELTEWAILARSNPEVTRRIAALSR
jgi:hypothetical protein